MFGEILGAAAGWTVSYDLAPERLLGHYQGMWQFLADGSSKVAGPVAVGWAALAAGFAALAASSPPLVTWSAAHARSAAGPPPAAEPLPTSVEAG